MSDFYLIQMGGVFLTDDGSEFGLPCRTTVRNLDQLYLDHVGRTRKAADGTVKNFIAENEGKGVDIITEPLVIYQETLDELRAMINTANANDSTIAFTAEYGPRLFNVLAKPLFVDGLPPLRFGSEIAGTRQYEVVIALTTESMNPA